MPSLVRRITDDYAEALMAHLPFGALWPRERDTFLHKLLTGLAGVWQLADSRAADLLEREADPRTTLEMLPDWERNFGLPEKCVAEPLTLADRRAALVEKMTLLGGQSRGFFIALAARLGYSISIQEFSPFMCGVSECGDTTYVDAADPTHMRWELGSPEMRFVWTVRIGGVRLTWFRAGEGELGVDPHLSIALATDLECMLNKYKPAHTYVALDYSGIETGGALAGTP